MREPRGKLRKPTYRNHLRRSIKGRDLAKLLRRFPDCEVCNGKGRDTNCPLFYHVTTMYYILGIYFLFLHTPINRNLSRAICIIRYPQDSNHRHKKIISATMRYVYNPEEAFVTTLGTFTLFGLWPSAVKHPILSFFYKIYGFSYQSLYIVSLLPTQMINIYFMRDDIGKLIESLFFTFTCAAYATKLFLFLLNRKKIEEFFERLQHPIFAPRRKEHLVVLTMANNTAKSNSIVYLALCLFTCLWWILYPFVDSKKEKVLLFAAWYPFDTSTNPIYGYTYAFQTLLLLTTASMASMMDMLVTNFYVLMTGQIQVLKQDFRLLADTVFTRKLSSANYKIQRHLSSIKSSESLFSDAEYLEKTIEERIILCTKHYEAIYIFVNDVTNLFQIGIVVQVCASSIVICVTCFELTSLSPNTLQFYVIMQYQVCMLVQIFIYTWRGNDIIVQSSELKDAIYECAWTSIADKEFRKSLCIIMSRLQKSVQLRVGNFFLLSVDTFFRILKSAYSFYIVLKQVQISDM